MFFLAFCEGICIGVKMASYLCQFEMLIHFYRDLNRTLLIKFLENIKKCLKFQCHFKVLLICILNSRKMKIKFTSSMPLLKCNYTSTNPISSSCGLFLLATHSQWCNLD